MKFPFIVSVLLVLPAAFWIGYSVAPEAVPVPLVPAVIEVPGVPADCTDSVNLAVVATEDRCSRFLDCRNVRLHPYGCSSDCKYHALEGALDTRELDEEWRDYPADPTEEEAP